MLFQKINKIYSINLRLPNILLSSKPLNFQSKWIEVQTFCLNKIFEGWIIRLLWLTRDDNAFDSLKPLDELQSSKFFV